MPYKPILFTCHVCQKESWGLPGAKYCGSSCAVESRRNQVERVCQTCGKRFQISPAHVKNGEGKYCSRECKHIAQRIPIEKQFWTIWATMEKPEDPQRCWLWPGSRTSLGYGRIKAQGETYRAHRLSLTLHGVPLPEGQQGCHTCNTPPCVRVHPLHLYGGTQQQNIDDRQRSEHTSRGEHHSKAKLTNQAVADIRATWEAAPKKFGLQSVLGRKYGVAPHSIGRIVRGEGWSHRPSHDAIGIVQAQAIQDATTVHANERNGRAKLTNRQVQTIRQKHQRGANISALVQQFQITKTHVQYILKGVARSLP